MFFNSHFVLCPTCNDCTQGGSYREGGGQKASLPVNHLKQYTFRIFNSIVAQCISITIPASPNLVPTRLVEPTIGILGPPNNQYVTPPLIVPLQLTHLKIQRSHKTCYSRHLHFISSDFQPVLELNLCAAHDIIHTVYSLTAIYILGVILLLLTRYLLQHNQLE